MNKNNNHPYHQQRKRKVLEEDEYIQLLEDVIEKNYFPHLSTLSKQLDYLNQSEVFDLPTLRTVYREMFPSLDLPSHSSNLQNNHLDVVPFSSSRSYINQAPEAANRPHMSIPEFFEKYISEDNYSYLQIQEKDLKEFRKKYHWAYEPNNSLLTLTNHPSNTTQTPQPSLFLEDDPNATLKEKQQRAGLLMLYYIDNKVLSEDERSKMDKILAGEEKVIGDERPAKIDTWNFRVRNGLMFPPELEDSEKICQVRDNETNELLLLRNNILPSSSSQQLLIENGASAKDTSGFLVPTKPSSKLPSKRSSSTQEKVIQRENVFHPGMQFVQEVDTYFRGKVQSDDFDDEDSSSHQFTPLESPHTPSTISSFPPSATNSPPSSSSFKWKNDALVSMSPIPKPGKGFLATPLMTWGKVIGPILEIETELRKAQPSQPTSSHKEKNINISSIHSLSSSRPLLGDDPNLPHFYLTPMAGREKIGYDLDAKRYSSKEGERNPDNRRKTIDNSSIFHGSSSKLSSSSSVVSYSSRSSSKSKSNHRLSLQDLTPNAQQLAKKVQATLKQKIFQEHKK